MMKKEVRKFVSVRVENLPSISRAKTQYQHDHRTGYVPDYVGSGDNVVVRDFDIDEFTKKQARYAKKITGRKLQKNAERYFRGILTFSKTMKEDYKNDRRKFLQSLEEFMEILENEMDMEALSVVIHDDETTPHVHFIFNNISRKTGRTVLRSLGSKGVSGSKGFSRLQDLAGKAFERMGYERGRPKAETGAEHMNISTFKRLKELEEELRKTGRELLAKVDLLVRLLQGEDLTEEEKETIRKEILPHLWKVITEKYGKHSHEVKQMKNDIMSKLYK